MAVTVAGSPQCFTEIVTREPKWVACPAGKELNLQNIGMSTLWISFDGKTEFHCASGTSFDARMEFQGFWRRTKLGVTKMACLVTS